MENAAAILTQVYVPKICEDVTSNYTGHVVYRIPDFDEQLDLMEVAGAVVNDDTSETASQMAVVRKLNKVLPRFIVSVELTRKSDSWEIKTLAEVAAERPLLQTYMELCFRLLAGFQLGNG
jgi:hypothetical protein